MAGGTHFDFNDVPFVIPASLRGIDMATWYTTAWFLTYLAHSPRGARMLLTDRWRNDAAAGHAAPGHDPNMYSWHYRSRLDVHLGDRHVDCEDLRAGCAGQTTPTTDGYAGTYSFANVDQ